MSFRAETTPLTIGPAPLSPRARRELAATRDIRTPGAQPEPYPRGEVMPALKLVPPLEQMTPRQRRRLGLDATPSRWRAVAAGLLILSLTVILCLGLLMLAGSLGIVWRPRS